MGASACKNTVENDDTKLSGDNSEINLDSNIDPRNASYIIDGEKYTLIDGYNEKEVVKDSSSKIITKYFGNEVYLDLNNNGGEDVVFLLTQETGGSGTFFYAVAAINTNEGWVGSNAVFIGDRIAPQSTDFSTDYGSVAVVNYLERNDGEAMTDESSLGKSIWLKFNLESMKLSEVALNENGIVQ